MAILDCRPQDLLVESFDSEHHPSKIRELLIAHGMNEALADELPKIGGLVYLDGFLVAAGFLRKLENSKVLMIDGYITNPECSPFMRDVALNRLTIFLVKQAREAGAHSLIGYSTDIHTLERSQRFGFRRLPHAVIELRLS